MRRKKVMISACLLGEACRYDGTTKQADHVIKAFDAFEIIPFCPEAPVLGTPRGRISVIKKGDTHAVVRDDDGVDVTALIVLETENFIQHHKDVDAIVLKSKSPSCGVGTTPIFDTHQNILEYGNGIAAQMLLDTYTKIMIVDEKEYSDD